MNINKKINNITIKLKNLFFKNNPKSNLSKKQSMVGFGYWF